MTADDFLGQIMLSLKEVSDGREHKFTMNLKGEDVYENTSFDRGEIEFKVLWTEKKFEDDLIHIDDRWRFSIKIQSFIRRVLAKMKRLSLKSERDALVALVRRRAVQITNTCRIRLARREYRKLEHRQRAAKKIQQRVRILIAKLEYLRLRDHRNKTILVQKTVRGFIARAKLRKLRQNFRERKGKAATCIQQQVRGYLIRIKLEAAEEEKKKNLRTRLYHVPVKAVPVSQWIGTYGRDPEYGLRRNRRMTEKAFKKMLTMKYIRFVTKYGLMYLDQYPPPVSHPSRF